MLDVALKFLTDELNGFMLRRTGGNLGDVEIGKLVDDMGKWAVKENQLRVAVVNVEEERALREQLPETSYVNGRNVTLEPELKVNMYVVFAANFKTYATSLLYLAHVLTFFQAHSSFNAESYPNLDDRIRRLSVELQSLTYEQLNQLWGFIGGKQLPSAIYKVRVVALQDLEPTSIGEPITHISLATHGP